MIGELEAKYVEMLDVHGFVWGTHVSWFTELLLARIPGLLRRLSGSKLSILFDLAVQNNIQNSQKIFKLLLNIGGPIRQAMPLKYAHFNFYKAS